MTFPKFWGFLFYPGLFPGLEINIYKFQDFSRFSMTTNHVKYVPGSPVWARFTDQQTAYRLKTGTDDLETEFFTVVFNWSYVTKDDREMRAKH